MFTRIVATCILTLPALAGQVTYSTVATSSTQTTLPRFDPALGPLTGVRLESSATVHVVLHAENVMGSFPIHSQLTIVTQSTASLPYPSGDWSVMGNIPFGVMLAPFDGTIDYGGSSGVTVTVLPASFGPASHDVPIDATALDYFSGALPLPVTVAPPTVTLVWPGLMPMAYVDASSDMTLSVTYFFGTYPARFCTSDTTMPCPCGSGIGNTGCPNSVGSGADLVSNGASSSSAPTFSLSASGLPSTTTGLLFGGTATLQVGQVFGDGMRCVTGTISRLGIHTAQNGTIVFPVPPSAAGELRAYQVWYRNVASFCTPATYNLTSGVVTVWTP